MNNLKKWMFCLRNMVWALILPLIIPTTLTAEETSPLDSQPDEAFIEYVQKQGSPVSIEEAWALVQEGYLVAQAISVDNLEGLKDQAVRQRLHQANSVIWYFMWRASTIGTPFTEGMFDLPDPQGKYWEFFSSIPGSYSRLSSHYKGRTLGGHKGVDLFPEDGEILPATKRTILFNRITAINGTQRLYLKPEDHGVSPKTPKEAAHHTWDYIRSRPIVTYFAPRSSPLPLREEFPESDNMNQFKKLVSALPIDKAEKKRAEQRAEQYGYGGMVQFLAKDYPEMVQGLPEDITHQEEIGQFLQSLSEEFSDDLLYRTGHEVVIRPEWIFMEPDAASTTPAAAEQASPAGHLTPQ